MTDTLHFLFIEDNPADFLLVKRHLAINGLVCDCDLVESLDGIEAALARRPWDLILSDFSVPGLAFRDSLDLIQRTHPEVPVILMSGTIGEEQAVDLLKVGVADFVLKGKLSRLIPAIERALKDAAEHQARRTAEVMMLRTLDALERSNNELAHLTFAASHDLQEPVRGIVSFAQLIERRLGVGIDAELQRDLRFLVNSAYRMRDIVKGLADFAEVANSDEKFAVQDCGAVLDEATEGLDQQIRQKGATVSHGPLPQVNGNRGQLLELFHILLANSLKFARPGTAPRIAITAQSLGDHWQISVSDNGIGIDSQYFDQLFWPFKRLEAHVDYPGPGLGLAIARRVVEKHGGQIWIESTVGTGTTIFFTLPVLIP